MTSHIHFLLACLGMGLIATYAGWLRLRVWMFRQDLFQVRDHLWDSMLAEGTLDDPAHREFRDEINAIIRIAPMLSFFLVIRIMMDHEVTGSTPPRQADGNPTIELARRKAFYRIAHYLVGETISGVVLLGALKATRSASLCRRWFTQKLQFLFDWHAFGEIDKQYSATLPGHAAL